ncbi:hypothetical protein FRC96_20260 [Lujinxingia vulgaris]|uniref:CDP-alcohol phosphatidyltransferase n=1 Tax=Lujinxingia vulgaris TaxID=2600176 RepID=A0A5C6X1R4_9DELT|nr:CDP-alcohol phosphatidyltransferase family protein [Lujinxingia vulgaris]TXD31807.1 hypothetical protein FRC96_20260 [Lujinxingia vulgaris]
MTSLIQSIRDVYQASKKKEDIAWNTYVARPIAAILVALLRPTPLTPNQVTFLGVAVFFVAAAAFIALPGAWGFLVGALLVQLSYLFDCADGQLARLKSMTSEVGSHLDFLMDELKAMTLAGALGIRLWMLDAQPYWLIVATAGVFLVGAATSLTNFVRRPEYAGQEIKPGDSARKRAMPASLIGKGVWVAEAVARYFVHYPSWIMWVALAAFVLPFDAAIVFLVLYLGVYMVYLARTTLAILLKLAHPGFYRS